MPIRSFSHANNNHRDTKDNTAETAFDFTPENYEHVHKILGRYPSNYKASGIIPLLDLAQRQCGGWLPLAAMNKVARVVDVLPIRVYEVATFYTMFNRYVEDIWFWLDISQNPNQNPKTQRSEKNGKYFIQLCGTTPCMICGSEEIKQVIEDHLDIKEGETTKDGLFTLREVECLGACSNAPMVQINDDFYENLTPDTMRSVLDACASGKAPAMNKWGSLPMNGQLSCEGPLGKTSLLWKAPPGPGAGMRPDSELQPKVDPATIKEEMLY